MGAGEAMKFVFLAAVMAMLLTMISKTFGFETAVITSLSLISSWCIENGVEPK